MYKEKTIPVVVNDIRDETAFVKRFRLSSIDGKPLPKFSGGAHISTYIEAKELLVRQYSLTSNPDHTQHYEIAVRLSDISRGGSRYWHKSMKVGDKLHISYPKNHFPLSFKAKHHVFYAAGIGITPFLSMMKELQSRNASFELHYASKSRDACAFYDFHQKHYLNHCRFYFSNKKERISASSLEEHPIGTHVYFCGPDTFISDLTGSAYQLGYPPSAVHMERFTPPQPKEMKPFHVQLTDGTLIQVSKDQTLLEALLNNGVKAPYSCRVGRCGTSELQVIEGEIAHYDSFLSEEQKRDQSRILTCVSRAKSELLVLNV
ncbi:PDR/VanB family oxidoreductase [Fictibacillus phosphorivorans]|uniref:PDR/VanB family oxidoreductase n=1 Tax=Fictibacillus phosphorivorans TaxID=1221500 RepID=UPI00203F669D|nr:PDR/VanB family oxidoreductase [Fictibacillus phosphorivorans]MCM3719907.1 PDR/VanB family oxidoreductase [Fictibacillus phosphorivorans]MCM3777639.1 PDR/VanB family oxidoreductase [Fictibacillus phosphorivorans]